MFRSIDCFGFLEKQIMKMQNNRLLIMILECEKLIKFLQNYFTILKITD